MVIRSLCKSVRIYIVSVVLATVVIHTGNRIGLWLKCNYHLPKNLYGLSGMHMQYNTDVMYDGLLQLSEFFWLHFC